MELRGAGDPRSIVDKSIEMQASEWKADVKREFANRYEGYAKLLKRLENERHPNATAERTDWFNRLIVDVRKESGK